MKKECAVPFFSIVLPIYNVEKYLNRCIDSILKQGFDDYEIILVDDGSKDSCGQLCDEWSVRNKKIRTIHKENAGLGYARNTGLNAAQGEYILFLDSDDYIRPGMLSKVHNAVCENDVDAVFFGFERIDKNGKSVLQLKPCPEKCLYTDKSEIMNQLLPDFIARNPYTGVSRNLRISAWNCCLNREFLIKNELKFVSERDYISEDVYFYIELFACLQKVSIMDDIFYCYCQNEGSLTFSYKKDRYERLKKFYQAVNEKANLLHYDGQVQLRLNESFIASVMGCLKMEVANCKEVGIRESYCRMKNISSDEYLYQAVKGYPLGKYEGTWKFFAWGIVSKQYGLLYIALLLKYITRGV